jgi:hypothetical protein
MTSEQIRQLALTLYAIVFECERIAELEVWHRCLRACRRRDVEPPTAVLISEALTGYLYDRNRLRTPLVTPLAKAQAVLHQTAGAADDGEPRAAMATRLTPSAIAALVGWALTAGEHPVGAADRPDVGAPGVP